MKYYTIKSVIKCLNISEQGLYKKIRTNNNIYIEQGLIITKTSVINGSLKAQILITEKGLNQFISEKGLKEGVTLADIEIFEEQEPLNQSSLVLNQDTKPKADIIEPTTEEAQDTKPTKPQKFSTKPSEDTTEIYKELIEELKKDNNTLRAELIKQSKDFTTQLQEGLKEQEERLNKRFDEQLQKQADNYNSQLEKILNNFNKTITAYQLQLEEANKPQENNIININAEETTPTETKAEAEEPPKKKGFFARLFSKE